MINDYSSALLVFSLLNIFILFIVLILNKKITDNKLRIGIILIVSLFILMLFYYSPKPDILGENQAGFNMDQNPIMIEKMISAARLPIIIAFVLSFFIPMSVLIFTRIIEYPKKRLDRYVSLVTILYH